MNPVPRSDDSPAPASGPREREALYAELGRERARVESAKEADSRMAEFERWKRSGQPAGAGPIFPPPRPRRMRISFRSFLAPRRSVPASLAVIAWTCLVAALACPLHGFPDSSVREIWRSTTWSFLAFFGLPVALLFCLPLLCWRPQRVGWRVAAVLLAGAISGWFGWLSAVGHERGYRACNGCSFDEVHALSYYAYVHDGWYPRGDLRGFAALIACRKEDGKEFGIGNSIWSELWVHHSLRIRGRMVDPDDLNPRTCYFTYIPGHCTDEVNRESGLVLGYWPDFVAGSYRVIHPESFGPTDFMSAAELLDALERTRQYFESKARPYDPASFVLRTEYR